MLVGTGLLRSAPPKGGHPSCRLWLMLPLFCRRAALLLIAILLAACGGATRLAYDNGDAAVLVMAEQYLDLEGQQWKIARGAVHRFHSWHRKAELPRYVELLEGAAGRVGRGLTRADVEWGIQGVRTRYAALVEAAAVQGAPLLSTLDAENIATLERRFATNDRKRVRETLSGDATKRERERVAGIVKRVEEWTGPLADSQREIVRGFVQATPDHPRHAHEHQTRKQRELLALLERNDGPAKSGPTPERLRAFLVAWEGDRGAERRDYQARFVQLIVDLDRSLTATQRARAVERLNRYAEDLRVLSRGA